MKKASALVLFVLSCLCLQAQTEKGTFQVGIGGLPVIYPNNSSPTGYSLRANVGYFPVNKLSVGVLPFMGKVDDMTSVGAGLYLRYYVTNSKFSLFVEGGSGFGKLEYEYRPASNGTMNSINIGPGVHYSFQNGLKVEFLLQYARLRNITLPESTLVGNTFIPTVGVQYFLFRK